MVVRLLPYLSEPPPLPPFLLPVKIHVDSFTLSRSTQNSCLLLHDFSCDNSSRAIIHAKYTIPILAFLPALTIYFSVILRKEP
jgi:hypothetical protein